MASRCFCHILLFLIIPIVELIKAWEQFIAFRDFSREAGSKTSFDPGLAMTGLIVTNIMYRLLPDPFWLLGFLFVVPLAYVQRSLNSAWAEVEPGLQVHKLPTMGDLLTVIVSWIFIMILATILP